MVRKGVPFCTGGAPFRLWTVSYPFFAPFAALHKSTPLLLCARFPFRLCFFEG